MYLVSEINYEYNDEVFHGGNYGDSYLPVSLYKSKENADKAALAKTLETIKKLELYSYGYDIDDVFNTNLLQKLLEQNGEEIVLDDGYGEYFDASFKKLLAKNDEKLTDTLINKVLKIKFFNVQEVEVVE